MALTVFPRYSELGRALFPSAGYIVRSLPSPHHPSNHLETRPGGTWGWRWGGPREEGGSAHQSTLPSAPHSPSCWAASSQAQSFFPFNIRDAVCLARCFAWSLVCTDPVPHMHKHTHTHTLSHSSGVQGHLPIHSLWQSRPLPNPLGPRREGLWGGGAGADSHSIKTLGTFFWRGG